MTLEATYDKVSNEFIDKLLEFSELNCDCIIEPTKTLLDLKISEMPNENFKDYFVDLADLKSKAELEKLNNLSIQVSLNKTITNKGYKLIYQKTLDSLAKVKNDLITYINSKCPKGYVEITKPFFNKTFNKVYIQIDELPNCFPGIISSYEFINNEWIILRANGLD